MPVQVYSPVDLQASWQILPFWRNSLHTQYLQIDHTKVYLNLPYLVLSTGIPLVSYVCTLDLP